MTPEQELRIASAGHTAGSREQAEEALRVALANLPIEWATRVMLKAESLRLADWMGAQIGQAWAQGYKRGTEDGRETSEQHAYDLWKPVAEQVRASASLPTQDELRARRAYGPGELYQGGPVEAW